VKNFAALDAARFKKEELEEEPVGKWMEIIQGPVPGEVKPRNNITTATAEIPNNEGGKIITEVLQGMTGRDMWIVDNTCREDNKGIVGNKVVILMWLLMRAGCTLPQGAKESTIKIIEIEEECCDTNKNRRRMMDNFKTLINEYEAGNPTVALKYDSTTIFDCQIPEHICDNSSTCYSPEDQPMWMQEALELRTKRRTIEPNEEPHINGRMAVRGGIVQHHVMKKKITKTRRAFSLANAVAIFFLVRTVIIIVRDRGRSASAMLSWAS